MTASKDGSLTLFENGEASKTVKLPGDRRFVRYINGEIISVGVHGKLAVLNKELKVLTPK